MDMSDKSTIFIVEDDSDARESLRVLLESAGYAVRDYGSAKEFLADDITTGDCLIADIRMPGMSGLELQEDLVKREIPLPIIIVTGHGDIRLAVRAMKAGAVDFIEKPFDGTLLLFSIQRALVMARRERDRVREEKEARALISLLTPRERQVLEKLVVGRSNKVVAYELSVSHRTIEVHRARIMDKLNAQSLSDLVRTSLAASLPPFAN